MYNNLIFWGLIVLLVSVLVIWSKYQINLLNTSNFSAENVRDMLKDSLIERIVRQSSIYGKTELVESEFPGVDMVEYLESVGFKTEWRIPGKEYVISWAEEN